MNLDLSKLDHKEIAAFYTKLETKNKKIFLWNVHTTEEIDVDTRRGGNVPSDVVARRNIVINTEVVKVMHLIDKKENKETVFCYMNNVPVLEMSREDISVSIDNNKKTHAIMNVWVNGKENESSVYFEEFHTKIEFVFSSREELEKLFSIVIIPYEKIDYISKENDEDSPLEAAAAIAGTVLISPLIALGALAEGDDESRY